MFKPQKCPNCDSEIDRVSGRLVDENASWYQLSRMKQFCPKCGMGVKYDQKSQRYGFAAFLLLAIPSILIVFIGDGDVAKGGGVLFFLSCVAGLAVFSKMAKLEKDNKSNN